MGRLFKISFTSTLLNTMLLSLLLLHFFSVSLSVGKSFNLVYVLLITDVALLVLHLSKRISVVSMSVLNVITVFTLLLMFTLVSFNSLVSLPMYELLLGVVPL